MKRALKFVNAGVFLLSLGLIFVKCTEVLGFGISMMDLTKLGFAISSEFADVVSSEDAIFWAVLTVVIAFGAFMGFVLSFLPKTAAYIFDILFSLGTGAVVMLTYGLHIMMQSESYGMYTVNHMVFILWIFLYFAIIIMSIVGLALKDKKKLAAKAAGAAYAAQNPAGGVAYAVQNPAGNAAYTAQNQTEPEPMTYTEQNSAEDVTYTEPSLEETVTYAEPSPEETLTVCPRCGASLKPQARFCGACGCQVK